MAAMDRDTFIPLGTSIVKLLLLASGQGALATAVGEGAGLLAKFRRTLEIGGNRAVFAEKIANDAAKQLLREHQGISEADWHMAARQTATLIDQLSEKERLAAGYNWEELRRTLLDLGGTDLRSDLADESARQAFDWVLEVACQRVADCFTEKDALASILESVEEVRSGIQRLAERPAGASQTRAVVADHMEVVRDLAPDPLEDRERELAELETFVRGSQDTWYAMEAGMISGKTALMSSFALNPPDGVHIVSFFIRRMGGDGNDWKSFSFVAGAQLAEILGDEYTERVSEPASQNTEFRQLLRRAATACQSDKNPRPLVLVIDGVDEDSYYERPDEAVAKSILSLLPRHLPEGVKLVTASRPNPRMPEDIVCNSSRTIASLKPSPIAQEKINQKDIETFFKSDLAVDIGAFLAACGGSLTVDELRQLIARRQHVDNVPSRDVKACVDHSPGRMLMRVNVGFGDREIPSYTLGHDAVLRAVLREISPDSFGEDGCEDEVWWAQVRKKSLGPYRKIIQQWVMDRAGKGWGRETPNYMLSEACFDIMYNSGTCWVTRVQTVFNVGRYDVIWSRFGKRSRVLKMINRECYMILDRERETVFEKMLFSLLDVIRFRELRVRLSGYVLGMFELHITHFGMTAEKALDTLLSIDDPNFRIKGLREVLATILGSEKELDYLPIINKVVNSLSLSSTFRDEITSSVINEILNVGFSSSVDCVELRLVFNARIALVDEMLRSFGLGSGKLCRQKVLEGYCYPTQDAIEISKLASTLEHAALQINDLEVRVGVLMNLARTCVNVDMNDDAIRIVENCLTAHRDFDDYGLQIVVMRKAAGVLVAVDMLEQARCIAIGAKEIANHIHEPDLYVKAMVEIVGALAAAGMIEEAQRCARKIDDHDLHAKAMVEIVGALAAAGMIEEAQRCARKIDDHDLHAKAMVEIVGALAAAGNLSEIQHAAQAILDPWWTIVARPEVLFYSRIACVLAELGEKAEAEQIAGRVDSMIRSLSGYPSWSWSPSDVIGALAHIGMIERARRIAAQLLERSDMPRAYFGDYRSRAKSLLEVVDALAHAGMCEDAERIARQIDDFKLRAEAFVAMVDALAHGGMCEDAERIASEIDDFKSRGRAIAIVVHALVDANMVGRAMKLAMNLRRETEYVDFWLRSEVLPDVVDALACVGMCEDAVRIASEIVDFESRGRAIAIVVHALVDANMVGTAVTLAKNLKTEVEFIDLLQRLEVLPDVVDAMPGVGVSDDVGIVATRFDDFETYGDTFVKIIRMFADMGLVEQVKKMMVVCFLSTENVVDAPLIPEFVVEVVDALVSLGEIERALRLFRGMSEGGEKGRVGSIIIVGLVRRRRFGEAIDMLCAEFGRAKRVTRRQDAASYCASLVQGCLVVVDLVGVDSEFRFRWINLMCSGLVRSWFYGASVWDHFDILVRVAPELALRLVDEWILGDREPRAASESDPDLGPEGPGGDAGSYS